MPPPNLAAQQAVVAANADANQATVAAERAVAPPPVRQTDKKSPLVEGKKRVVTNNPYDLETSYDAIAKCLGMVGQKALVSTIIDDAVAAITGKDFKNPSNTSAKNLKPMIDKFDRSATEKKVILFFALNAALQQNVTMDSLDASSTGAIQSKRDELLKNNGSAIQELLQRSNLAHEIALASPGVSQRVVSKLLSSMDPSEEPKNSLNLLTDYAIKLNPKNSDSVLLSLQTKISTLLERERQSPSGANFPRVEKMASDLNLIKTARITIANFNKISDTCGTFLDKLASKHSSKTKSGKPNFTTAKSTIPTEKFVVVFLESYCTNSPVALRKIKTELSNIDPSIRNLYLHHLGELMRLSPLINFRFNDNVYGQVSKLLKGLQGQSYQEQEGGG